MEAKDALIRALERVAQDINSTWQDVFGRTLFVIKDLAADAWTIELYRIGDRSSLFDSWLDCYGSAVPAGAKPEEYFALYVADQTQNEILQETRELWPACPAHSDHHLHARGWPDEDVSIWVCPSTANIRTTIGSLARLNAR